MSKKYFSLFVIIFLVFNISACDGKDNIEIVDEIVPASNLQLSQETAIDLSEETAVDLLDITGKSDIESASRILTVGESIIKGDKGSGPVEIQSRLGSIDIPEGLDYELYTVPYEGNTASIRVDIGIGNSGAGHILVSTTRMIKSLKDAVKECIRTNDFGTKDSIVGEEITYGGMKYKAIIIQNPDGTDVINFLVSYYKADKDWDGYVEIRTNGDGSYYKMAIDEPLLIDILEKLVVK